MQAGQTYYIGVNGSSDQAQAYDPLSGAGAQAGSTGTYRLSVDLHVVAQPDNTAPTSAVTALPAFSAGSFTVHWSGQDEPGGSGLAGFDVYVSDNGGAFALWQSQTPVTSAVFTGQDGHAYGFYSVARDFAGNIEAAPAAAQATTTVDAVAPTSQVAALPPITLNAQFTVNWSGADAPGGSGLADFDVYVSTDAGAYAPWLTHTTDTSAAFPGQNHHVYAFYSVARDNVGNLEAAPASPDATTSVNGYVQTLTYQAHKLVLHDANGVAVTLSFGGRNGSVDITRSVAPADSGDILQIVANQTDPHSTLTISTKSTARTNLTDVEIHGAMKSFSAGTSRLAGTFNVDDTLGTLKLSDVTGSDINILGSVRASASRWGPRPTWPCSAGRPSPR